MKQKNKTLHQRLETTLNSVVDSVDIDETSAKLAAAEDEKSNLQKEIEELNQAIAEWKEKFRAEHDGQEPSNDDR